LDDPDPVNTWKMEGDRQNQLIEWLAGREYFEEIVIRIVKAKLEICEERIKVRWQLLS
jgi:hypothetical protein